MGDFFECLVCTFSFVMAICIAISSTAISDWRDNDNKFDFFSEGNVVDNKVMFPDGNGGENCLSFPQIESGEERITLFLDESLMVVPLNNASWKIIFPVEDKFVVYNR